MRLVEPVDEDFFAVGVFIIVQCSPKVLYTSALQRLSTALNNLTQLLVLQFKKVYGCLRMSRLFSYLYCRNFKNIYVFLYQKLFPIL